MRIFPEGHVNLPGSILVEPYDVRVAVEIEITAHHVLHSRYRRRRAAGRCQCKVAESVVVVELSRAEARHQIRRSVVRDIAEGRFVPGLGRWKLAQRGGCEMARGVVVKESGDEGVGRAVAVDVCHGGPVRHGVQQGQPPERAFAQLMSGALEEEKALGTGEPPCVRAVLTQEQIHLPVSVGVERHRPDREVELQTRGPEHGAGRVAHHAGAVVRKGEGLLGRGHRCGPVENEENILRAISVEVAGHRSVCIDVVGDWRRVERDLGEGREPLRGPGVDRWPGWGASAAGVRREKRARDRGGDQQRGARPRARQAPHEAEKECVFSAERRRPTVAELCGVGESTDDGCRARRIHRHAEADVVSQATEALHPAERTVRSKTRYREVPMLCPDAARCAEGAQQRDSRGDDDVTVGIERDLRHAIPVDGGHHRAVERERIRPAVRRNRVAP